jgi:hypothetical protein
MGNPDATRRYARLYSDGSYNVCPEGQNHDQAIRLLSGSTDDDDTEIVLVDIIVVKRFGKPKLTVVADVCPHCGRSDHND